MTGRVQRRPHDEPSGEAEAKAAAMTTAIAGLRRRLKRDGIGDPSVRKELGKLEELLISLFEQAGRPGRHRRQASKAHARSADQEGSDTDVSELKPDPAEAITPADFVGLLWRYRTWSGDPSWRQMAARSRQRASHSAIYKAMQRQELPKLDVVEAIIIGCGGTEDLPAFVAAWHRINSISLPGQPESPELSPAPVPALGLVPR